MRSAMADANIVIVDYGLSNLFNLERAFIHIGARVTVSEDAETVASGLEKGRQGQIRGGIGVHMTCPPLDGQIFEWWL